MSVCKFIYAVLTSFSETGRALVYKYDIYCQLMSTIFSRPSDSFPENSEFTYDFNGRIGRQKLLWDKKIVGYIDCQCDTKGNLIKEMLDNEYKRNRTE